MSTKGAPLRPDEHVGYLLRLAYARAEEAAAAVIPSPFHARDLAVLSVLESRGPQSQQHLAELTRVNRTIMVKVVDGLEDRGLVRRGRDPADRRSYALTPTRRGRGVLRRLSADMAAGEDLLTANLARPERHRLAALLRRLLDGAKALDVGAPAQLCGYLITHAHHQLRNQARERLAQIELDSRRLGALAAVDEHQPCSQQRLAERLAVSAPVVAVLAEELADDGLVERARQRADRRRYDLTLTSKGRQRLRSGADIINDIDTEIASRLTPAGAAELHQLLAKLLSQPLVDPPNATGPAARHLSTEA